MPSSRMRVVVTGATGFLGRQVLQRLVLREDLEVIAACRRPDALNHFRGETLVGDLLDADYRKRIAQHADVICHTGTWAAFWGHAALERSHFLEPALDLLEQAERHGVQRYILASSVAIARRPKGELIDDFAAAQRTGYWPHLDRLIDLDQRMQQRAGATRCINLRLGHFVGAGNARGMVPALVPRLRTRLVPWLAGGRARLALVADEDLGEAFALASTVDGLDDYESFNICGPSFPTAREVFDFICQESGSPRPWFSVPYWAGYAFGWLMETLHPVLPGSAPFLTRSLVHVAEDWHCDSRYAARKLGYIARKPWQVAVKEALAELEQRGFPWPELAQHP